MITKQLLRKLLKGEAKSKDYKALEMDKKDRLKVKNAKGGGGEGMIDKALKDFPGVCISFKKLKEIFETYHKESINIEYITLSCDRPYGYSSDVKNFYFTNFYDLYDCEVYVIVNDATFGCIYLTEDDTAYYEFTDEEIEQCIVSRDEFIKDFERRIMEH